MTSDSQHGRRLWHNCLAAVKQEYQALDLREQDWIADRLSRIAELQKQLNDLFIAAGGPQACRRCFGVCCDCGRNHFTLANLLTFVRAGQQPPEPDFARPCPFLGEEGCLLEVTRRPFNCVTYICEPVLESLGPEKGETFLRLEKILHSHYLAFDRRYTGAGLCGLFIRAERLAGRPFLAPV
jgi:hypothetical protein